MFQPQIKKVVMDRRERLRAVETWQENLRRGREGREEQGHYDGRGSEEGARKVNKFSTVVLDSLRCVPDV
jgi:hypothetical protein